jgi:hypothetical protein
MMIAGGRPKPARCCLGCVMSLVLYNERMTMKAEEHPSGELPE